VPILDRLQGPADLRGLNEPELEQLASELGDGGLYVHADVTNEDEMAAAFGRVVERLGGIDILFNNAGSGPTPSISRSSSGCRSSSSTAWCSG